MQNDISDKADLLNNPFHLSLISQGASPIANYDYSSRYYLLTCIQLLCSFYILK